MQPHETFDICIFLSFLFFSFAQNKTLVLTNNKTQVSREIQENKRIKIETKEGEKMYGRFTIIDSSSILVDEQVILLEDIVKMKRKSLFIKIINPVIIATGALCVTIGIAGAVAGGYGYIATIVFLPPSIPLVLLSEYPIIIPFKNGSIP
jgi:small nuclear ribonucleoprotein (snRNP)-like protein